MTATNTSTQTVATPVATSPAQAVWQIALADYERAKAESERESAKHSVASETYMAEVAKGERFEAYGLKLHADKPRERLIRNTEVAIVVNEYAGKSDPTADDFAEIARRATNLVDDFLAFRESVKAAQEAYTPAEKAWEATLDSAWDAQKRLMSTPAPDAAAALYKLDVIVGVMTEDDAQDLPAIVAIRDDARRLFGSK